MILGIAFLWGLGWVLCFLGVVLAKCCFCWWVVFWWDFWGILWIGGDCYFWGSDIDWVVLVFLFWLMGFLLAWIFWLIWFYLFGGVIYLWDRTIFVCVFVGDFVFLMSLWVSVMGVFTEKFWVKWGEFLFTLILAFGRLGELVRWNFWDFMGWWFLFGFWGFALLRYKNFSIFRPFSHLWSDCLALPTNLPFLAFVHFLDFFFCKICYACLSVAISLCYNW